MARKSDVSMRRVLVTPAMATKFLERNLGNRRLDQRTVNRYLRDIELGRWQETGDTVKVTWEADTTPADSDILLDGQHRMSAIAKSGKSQYLWIAFGVPKDARGAIDQGKVRPLGQQIQIVKGETQGNAKAARAGVIHAIENPSVERMTFYQYEALYAKHYKGIDWSLGVLNGRKWGIAPLAGALAYAYPTAPAQIEAFAKQVRDGEGLMRSDPAYTLREQVRTTHMAAYGRRFVILATLHCAKAYIDGKPLSVLKPSYLLNPRAEKTQGIVLDALRYFGKIHGFQPEKVE